MERLYLACYAPPILLVWLPEPRQSRATRVGRWTHSVGGKFLRDKRLAGAARAGGRLREHTSAKLLPSKASSVGCGGGSWPSLSAILFQGTAAEGLNILGINTSHTRLSTARHVVLEQNLARPEKRSVNQQDQTILTVLNHP